MANAEVLLQFLKQNGNIWCDDCLSDKTGITPRQQINQLGCRLAKTRKLFRNRGRCTGCGKTKITNSLNPEVSEANQIKQEMMIEPKSSDVGGVRPWYWEGNIQAVLASYLAKNEFRMMSIANTALRESGKDIEAITPEGKTLWISVKGWPEKSQNTQARHWFSQGIFNIILYRDESKDVELALAFPDGFPTYHNLTKRIKWFQELAKFKIFWISKEGLIRTE